ncbi:sigma-70 family RNA polymerase sigma factor [Acinetobacter venetianus]|jgi:RNA polymerase sigma-70 factor (ECF subfamily)|uniref:sigma-70 family RNA polymerase sigma factor n=1 Tax=Acinetobacter venetianus TaxID=52133 RepID=UPI001A169AB1|nr:sigma-70 family RNA polymerase sigma factor [Acinetobacter venetianus]HIQ33286.1 sigma-70 family RNA polymerase sigma factor [Acinetobacter venetianus]HJP46527.1 sigma-70 family RNA polymerase sigma factor [Acinetobacter venetianus]
MNTTTNFSNEDLKLFQASRTFLFGLAYRLLGSVHETEDVLQEIFIKWQQQPKQDIINPQAWLTAVCTRHCIDLLRSHHKSRTEYIGTWLPEPYDQSEDLSIESDYTLSTAFLLVLEKLSAKERAAYLLHDIFNFDYIEISEFLQETQSYCRQLVTRGRKHIKAEPKMLSTLPTSRQLVLLDAFKDAVHSQNIGQLKELLSEDIQFAADGGGKVSAIRHPFIGQSNVLRFFERLLFIAWNELSWKICLLNGNLGFKLYDHNQTYVTAITFNFNQSQISDIYVLRNPEKLK